MHTRQDTSLPSPAATYTRLQIAEPGTKLARRNQEEKTGRPETMHRSSSYYLSSSSSSSSAGPSGTAGTMDVDQLPTYDPQSDAAKKEALDASRANLAHTLVHLVPVVVLLCGLLLWSFTAAASSEVGLVVEKKGSDYKTMMRARLTPKKSGSARSWNGSGVTTGVEDLDPIVKANGLPSKVNDNKQVGKNFEKEGLE